MSILDLESLIEEAERFDSAFNTDNWVDNPKWAWYATLSNWKDVHNAETFE
jgi:hypothetical protein